MMKLKTMDNCAHDRRTLMRHQIDIADYCPFSHNPLPGSTLTVCYRSRGLVLDIIPFVVYVGRYAGGLKNERGEIVVRDMETLVQRVADDCAAAVQVPVKVRADLLLWPDNQVMSVLCWSHEQAVCDNEYYGKLHKGDTTDSMTCTV